MGSLFGRQWLSSGASNAPAPPPPPRQRLRKLPSADDFEIIRSERIGDCWVASVRYPGAEHYEGLKTLVLSVDPTTLERLDPHFLPDKLLVARFEPGVSGFHLAVSFARMVAQDTKERSS